MTDLQLALFALGAIIIAAVILFNWWQEQRIRRETVRRFEGPIKDALMVEGYQPSPERAVREDDAGEDDTVIEHIERQIEQKIEPTFSFEPISAEATDPPPDEMSMDDTEEVSEVSMDRADSIDEQAAEQANASIMPEPLIADALPEAPHTQVIQPIEEATSEAAMTQSAPAIAGNLPPNVDEQIDLIAVIVPAQQCSGEKVREAMLPLPHLDKPSEWMGLNSDGLWRHFTKDQEQTQFSLIVGSLQLADRSGAVSTATLHEFQRKAEETANRLPAQLEWRGPASPQRYAQQLDQFCIEVDVMVRLHLIANQNSPFAGTKLRGLAEAGGMTLQDDGMFHYVDDSNDMQFTLVNQAAANQEASPFSAEMLRTALIQAVTLQLDVTRVANCPEAFSKMTILARRMEQGLNARLVDDNQRVLGDAEIEKIRQQLKKICATMLTHDIAPGSPTALRLFS